MWVRNSEKPSHTTMFSFVCAFCYAYKQLLRCLRADSLKVCWVWTLVTLIDKTRLDCQPCFEGFKPKQPDRPKLPVTRTRTPEYGSSSANSGTYYRYNHQTTTTSNFAHGKANYTNRKTGDSVLHQHCSSSNNAQRVLSIKEKHHQRCLVQVGIHHPQQYGSTQVSGCRDIYDSEQYYNIHTSDFYTTIAITCIIIITITTVSIY